MTVLTNALHFVYALEGFALMIRQRMRKKNASGTTIPLLPGETQPCEYFQLAFLLSSFFFSWLALCGRLYASQALPDNTWPEDGQGALITYETDILQSLFHDTLVESIKDVTFPDLKCPRRKFDSQLS